MNNNGTVIREVEKGTTGRQRRISKTSGVTIGHEVGRGGEPEGCTVM